MNAAGVILNGGHSTRMGQCKSKLLVNGETFLSQLDKELNASTLEKVFVSGTDGIRDSLPGLGPLIGIYSCLKELQNFRHVVFVPVDMPLVTKDLIQYLISMHRDSFDVSCFADSLFPLIVSNKKSLVQQLRERIDNKQRRVVGWLQSLYCQKLVSLEFESQLKNINTPKDYQCLKS